MVEPLRLVGFEFLSTFSRIAPVFWSIAIYRVFFCWRASIISFILTSSFEPFSPFLSSFTRSAYLRVLSVCSTFALAGEILAIIVVLLLPMNESLST